MPYLPMCSAPSAGIKGRLCSCSSRIVPLNPEGTVVVCWADGHGSLLHPKSLRLTRGHTKEIFKAHEKKIHPPSSDNN